MKSYTGKNLKYRRNVLTHLQQREYRSRKTNFCSELASFVDDVTSVSTFDNNHIFNGGSLRSTFMIVFSHDGSLLASSHGNHKIKVCQLPSLRCIQTLSGHPRSVWSLCFHPSSNDLLASGCLGGQVRVWDLQGRSEIWNCEKGTTITSLCFHPHDRILAIATGNQILLWDWSHPAPFASVEASAAEEYVRLIRFDRYGQHLLTGITNTGLHRGWTEGLHYGSQQNNPDANDDIDDDDDNVPREPDTIPDPSLPDSPPPRPPDGFSASPHQDHTTTAGLSSIHRLGQREVSSTRIGCLSSNQDQGHRTNGSLASNHWLEQRETVSANGHGGHAEGLSVGFSNNKDQDVAMTEEPEASQGRGKVGTRFLSTSRNGGPSADRDDSPSASNYPRFDQDRIQPLPTSQSGGPPAIRHDSPSETNSQGHRTRFPSSSGNGYPSASQRHDRAVDNILSENHAGDSTRGGSLASLAQRQVPGRSSTRTLSVGGNFPETEISNGHVTGHVSESGAETSQSNYSVQREHRSSGVNPLRSILAGLAAHSGQSPFRERRPMLQRSSPLVVGGGSSQTTANPHNPVAAGINGAFFNAENDSGEQPSRNDSVQAEERISPSRLPGPSSSNRFLTNTQSGGTISQRIPSRVVRVRRDFDGPELVQVRVISEEFQGVGDRPRRITAEDLSQAIIIRTEETFHVPDLPESQRGESPVATAARALLFDSDNSNDGMDTAAQPAASRRSGADSEDRSPFTGLPIGSSLLDHVPNRGERVEQQVSYPVSGGDGMVGHVTITRSTPADSSLLRALQLQRSPAGTASGNISRRTHGARRVLPTQLAVGTGGRRGTRSSQSPREEDGSTSEMSRRSRLSRFGFARTAIRRRSGRRRQAQNVEEDPPTFPQGEYRNLINQALADAFRGRWSNPAVANNINAVTHRLQWWDFRDQTLPDIKNAQANLLVPGCKLYSDASCDISPNGKFVVTFVPYNFPDSQFVAAAYSLEKHNLGAVLFSKKFGAEAITLSISPSSNHLLVGVAMSHYRFPAVPAPMAMICKLSNPTGKEGSMDLQQVVTHPTGDQPRLPAGLNIAKWVPIVGAGFVYGTVKGDLRICKPRFDTSRTKPSTPADSAHSQSDASTGQGQSSFRSRNANNPHSRHRGQATQTRRRTHSAGTQTDLTSRFVRRRLNPPGSSSTSFRSRLAVNMANTFNNWSPVNQPPADSAQVGTGSSGPTYATSDPSRSSNPTSATNDNDNPWATLNPTSATSEHRDFVNTVSATNSQQKSSDPNSDTSNLAESSHPTSETNNEVTQSEAVCMTDENGTGTNSGSSSSSFLSSSRTEMDCFENPSSYGMSYAQSAGGLHCHDLAHGSSENLTRGCSSTAFTSPINVSRSVLESHLRTDNSSGNGMDRMEATTSNTVEDSVMNERQFSSATTQDHGQTDVVNPHQSSSVSSQVDLNGSLDQGHSDSSRSQAGHNGEMLSLSSVCDIQQLGDHHDDTNVASSDSSITIMDSSNMTSSSGSS